MKKIILATNNDKKVKEINNFFLKHTIDVKIVKCEIEIPDDIETGLTFYENALSKAKYVFKKYNKKFPVLAEDSGLCIKSLNNFPGIYSARFNVNNDYSYVTKNNALIQMIKNFDDKSAFFHSCFVLIENDNIFKFEGEIDGLILENPKMIYDFFGYDPIFYLPKLNCFFSDLSIEQKNAISHRGQALEKILDYFKK